MDFSGSVSGAYGAGRASGAFDPIAFIKKPQVILRLVSWLFSIIVFACISASGWIIPPKENEKVCQYNQDPNACNYGTVIGVIAFLACIVFLLIDAMFDNFSNVKTRRFAVLGDLGFSALWTFLWFVGFCYLTDAWRRGQDSRPGINPDDVGRNDMQAAIAFSFFSILSWGGLTFFATQRYRQGVNSDFQGGFGDDAFQAGASTGPVPGAVDSFGDKSAQGFPQQGGVGVGYNPTPFTSAQNDPASGQQIGSAYQQPFETPHY